MRRQLTVRRMAAGAFSALALAGAWLLLAPPQLGGSTSYVILYGSSMEPGFHRGDLVLLRPASDYRVGDVAAYDSENLGRLVMHRIVERLGERYVFKGDNNDFLDSSRPVRAQIAGTDFLRVPAIGKALTWVREPFHAAILAALLALFVAGGGASAATARRRRGRPVVEAISLPVSGRSALALSEENARTALMALGCIAAMCGLLAVLAFTRPATRLVPTASLFKQTGQFSYSAEAPRGLVYPNGSVSSGQPVFVRLVPDVAVRFDYRLKSAATHDLSGTGRLVATLHGDNGWERQLTVQPDTAFTGGRVVLRGTLKLGSLLALGKQVEAITGTRSDSYALTLQPEISVRGTVGDQVIDEEFAPPLGFRLDPLVLRVETNLPGNGNGNALTRSQPGLGSRVEANRLSLLGITLSVGTARRLGLVGGLLALLGAAAIAFVGLRRREDDEPARIVGRYGGWMVDVEPRHRPREIVREVTAIEGLARLAERYDRMILHEERNGVHSYFVEEDGIVYRYRSEAQGVAAERSWLGSVASIGGPRR